MLKEPVISQEEQPLWQFFAAHNLWRTGYEPICQFQESNSPLVSKYGGLIPRLPQNPVIGCPECGHQKEVLLQLFIPSLPQAVQELFPEQIRRGLIVFTYCTECMPSNENNGITFNVYGENELANLVFDSPPGDAKIKSSVIGQWTPFISIDASSEKFSQCLAQAGIDDLKMEDFVRSLKDRYAGTCYLLGTPDFTEGEYDPPEGMVLLANFEQDKNFSMMWGDAGIAQLWMRPGDGFGEFNLTWISG